MRDSGNFGFNASDQMVSLQERQKNDGTLSGKSLDQLVQEYGLSSNLFRLRAVNDSRLIGKTIIDLDVRRKYGLNIIEVRRVDSSQHRFTKTIAEIGITRYDYLGGRRALYYGRGIERKSFC